MPMKPSGKRKKSTKSPPTSEKGMKRNAMSTDSLQNPWVGSSEVWISFASRIISSQSGQARPDVKLSFLDASFTSLTSSDMRGHLLVVRSANGGSALVPTVTL